MISVFSAEINYNSGKLKGSEPMVCQKYRKGAGENQKSRQSTLKFFHDEFIFHSG
jgi:hypothetical protein